MEKMAKYCPKRVLNLYFANFSESLRTFWKGRREQTSAARRRPGGAAVRTGAEERSDL